MNRSVIDALRLLDIVMISRRINDEWLLNMMMDATKNEDARVWVMVWLVMWMVLLIRDHIHSTLSRIPFMVDSQTTRSPSLTVPLVRLTYTWDGSKIPTRRPEYRGYFDSEQAVTSSMFTERGIDPSRVPIPIVVESSDIKRFQWLTTTELPKKDRKMMIVLDSLGAFDWERTDTADGKTTRDMTQIGLWSQLSEHSDQVGPLVFRWSTNHTYAVVGSMFPTKEMGGGSGLKYAASTIVYLTKKRSRKNRCNQQHHSPQTPQVSYDQGELDGWCNAWPRKD